MVNQQYHETGIKMIPLVFFVIFFKSSLCTIYLKKQFTKSMLLKLKEETNTVPGMAYIFIYM